MQISTVKSLNLPLAHYIGRPGKGKAGSALANPFHVSMGRAECVKAFRKYSSLIINSGLQPQDAIAQMAKSGIKASRTFKPPTRAEFMKELNSLNKDSVLCCFCYDEPYTLNSSLKSNQYPWHCHGEVLASLWFYMQAQAVF